MISNRNKGRYDWLLSSGQNVENPMGLILYSLGASCSLTIMLAKPFYY
jgi:hypothetical protein